MINLKQHLDLLGYRARDCVTGFEGVVASVTFDLYGCIQAILNPGMQQDGKLGDPQWFDVNRLEIINDWPRVMEAPKFDWSPEAVSSGAKGPGERPSAIKY